MFQQLDQRFSTGQRVPGGRRGLDSGLDPTGYRCLLADGRWDQGKGTPYAYDGMLTNLRCIVRAPMHACLFEAV
jgi:hypothetical protein